MIYNKLQPVVKPVQKKNDGGYNMEDANDAPVAGADYTASIVEAVIKEIPSFDSESEEALALRYGSRRKEPQELVYEFTRDLGLIQQYCTIYEREFRIVQKSPNFRLLESERDRSASFLIARQGNFCVGGVRLIVKTPRKPDPLPMEINGFRIENHFPHLSVKQISYGQMSRLAVLPEFRGGSITLNFLRRVCGKAAAMNLGMLFGIAPLLQSKLYLRHLKAMGLKESKIHSDIDLPPYPTFEEVRHYLVSTKLDKAVLKDENMPSESEEEYQWENV